MAKKENVKVTPDGLQLVTVLNNSTIAEMNGFYGKEVYFSDGFNSEILSLFQVLGNLGAYARNKDWDNEIDYIIVSNFIMENSNSEGATCFYTDYQTRLNQNSSPYRRMKIITENHLIWYAETRAKSIDDELSLELIKRYKSANKVPKQQELF